MAGGTPGLPLGGRGDELAAVGACLDEVRIPARVYGGHLGE
jgi:hypothetical protein